MTDHRTPSPIIGIDEVGRGPLAGPVTVCAVAIPWRMRLVHPAGVPLRDSKKLSPRQRAAWVAFAKHHPHIRYAVATVSPAVIDRINIARAADRAASRALRKLIAQFPSLSGTVNVFLDGGLHATPPIADHPSTTFILETLIKGDERIPAISLASIIAKEHRDAYMRRMHAHHPAYSFDRNSGYGTKAHIAALRTHGTTPLHRASFLGFTQKKNRT